MLGWRDSATWIELTNDSALSASLLEAIAAAPEESPALIARLRKQFAPELVAAALELCAARKKAAGKLATTGVLCADREGVEMASSTRAARWKAQRFARARGEHQRVLDLFCGIGADLSALVDVCGESMVIGVENDPLRAWMACGNAEGRVREADVRSEAIQSLLPNALIHCDPPRRDHRGRAWKRGEETIEEFDLATMLSWMRAAQGGALKLGPGVARELIVSADAECEYIEVDGTMEQCVVWTGALATAPGTCRATRIAGETITRCGVPRTVPQADELSAYLFEPCAAIERAGLLADLAQELDAREVEMGLGLLTGAQPCASPYAECFEIVGEVAQSPNAAVARRFPSAMQEHFRSVRVRGKSLDAIGGVDRVTKELQCQSDGSLVLFSWRRGAKAACVVARAQARVV